MNRASPGFPPCSPGQNGQPPHAGISPCTRAIRRRRPRDFRTRPALGELEKIDRVDVDNQENARVLDYKSGRGTTSKSDILRGLAFQTPLYALAVSSLAKDISQVAESAYLHIPLRDTSGKLNFTGPVAEDEIVQAVVDRAGLFVERIRGGVFPSAPGKPVAGSGLCSTHCQLAGICRVTRTTIAKANNLYS